MIYWLEHAPWPAVVLSGLAGAVLFELGTVLLRFGFRLRSAERTAWIARFTFGLRIHHGFVGMACLLCAALPGSVALRYALLDVGIALALSDAMHHFVVLPLAVGATEFDLFYDRSSP